MKYLVAKEAKIISKCDPRIDKPNTVFNENIEK